MADRTELQSFLDAWEHDAKGAIRVMESLPEKQYDFRPDPKGRSIGEMAWHLAEIDAYMSKGTATGQFDFNEKFPELTRPKEVKQLAPAYKKAHEIAVGRIKALKPEAMYEEVKFFDGSMMKRRDVLWYALLQHSNHHRAQLVLLCRLAGGTPPGLYGPNREEMAAMMEKMAAQKA
ncbi:MAG: DinB family protein [Hyphomicrobiales bacterium]